MEFTFFLDTLQPHEADELEQLVGCVPQADLAALAPGSELKPRERVYRHRIGVDAMHVTEDDTCAAPHQQRADSAAEPGQVGASDRAIDGEGDRVRPCAGHRDTDRPAGRNSSRDEF